MKIRNVLAVILFYELHLITPSECKRNNVCKTINDYRNIQDNPNCYYNPDLESGPEEIVRRYGFPFESYEVTTQDGYILTLFRIPHNGSGVVEKRPVVFFQHGIAADGLTWMISGAESPVFVFANRGYDVWISNFRGTDFSSRHVRYTPYDREYWIYSFHELGVYDLPAMLDFVAEKTNQRRNITYVGHSMGSTTVLVYASVLPRHAENNLRSVIALAPVAYMDHIQSMARVLAPFRYVIWDFLSALGIYGVGPNLKFKTDLLTRLCTNYPFIALCANFSIMLSGINPSEVDESSFAIGIRRFPRGVSLKTLFHYAQIVVEKRRFQFFDYGPELNPKLYNSSLPPEYPLDQIKVPIHLFYGKRDLLATEKDVFYLYDQLKTEKSINEIHGYSHLDFLSSLHSLDFYQNTLSNYL